MADLVLSLLKTILEAGFNIKSALEKAGHNAEDCRRIGDLLQTLSAIANAKYLEDSTTKGLEVALQRASVIVKNCEGKSKTLVSRAFKANQIADELRGVCFDILLNLNVAIFANLADIKETVAQNNSLSAQILEICAANVDLLLLPQKIDRLPQTYCNSTDDASYQNENKRETKETGLARPEFKTEKDNALVDSKVQRASLSDGSSNSASLKSVIGQGDPSIVYKIISESTGNMTAVTSIDGHPTKTWIVMSYEGGNVSIWDYQEKKTVMELQVNEVSGKFAHLMHGISQYWKETGVPHSVCSAKFIAQGKWLVMGNGDGYIVYACTDSELKEPKKFKAHDNSVDLLAIHPTKPYLISSSYHGKTIKLWSWTSDSSMDWVPIKTFFVKPTYPDGVRSLKFNPRETNTFACVTYENKVKVGNIKNSSPLTEKPMRAFEADYFFSHSHLHLMVTLSPSDEVQIWDLETSKVYRTLSLGGCKTTCIACHPTLPILVTTLDDGTVCFWDAITYRLQQRVQIADSHALDLVFMADINDTARLVVKFESMMVIMEVNYLAMENTSQWTDGGNYG